MKSGSNFGIKISQNFDVIMGSEINVGIKIKAIIFC